MNPNSSCNYNEATQTHFSLAFAELTADTRKIGSLYIYASRSFAQPLIDEVLKNEANGFGKIVRLKIKVTSRSFSNGQNFSSFDGSFHDDAELLDWQNFDKASNKWTLWAVEAIAAENAIMRP